MRIELESRKLAYECERPIRVKYRDVEIDGQRVDLIIEGLIVVELKAVIRLDDVHTSQFVSYLRTTGLRGGLLINFLVAPLQQGLRRVVL
jgi:GxxExxY protein